MRGVTPCSGADPLREGCCHKGGHSCEVFIPCLDGVTSQGCCWGGSQARREHGKGFPIAKRA